MPVYFVLILPAMVGMMGELPLSTGLTLVPGLNVTLLARDIAVGKATLGHTVAVLVATLGWAGLALLAATRFYVSERFINVGDPGQPKRRGWLGFGAGRAPDRVTTPRREPPTAGEAGVLFALGFLALVFVFFPLQRRDPVSGLLISQWGGLFVGSLVYALWTRRHAPTLLGVRRPAAQAVLAAALMGLGGWMVANLISQWVFPPSKEYVEAFRKLLITETRSLGMNLLLFAVTPAVCEELFFRGIIMRGLLTRMTPAGAIGMSAAMFSVFHVDIYRLLPTALLGVMLGLIAYRAGTWLASALAHFINNGILLVLGGTGLDQRLEGMGAAGQVALLVGAAVVVGVGAWWLLRLPVPVEVFSRPEGRRTAAPLP
jgi:sodium transport system permease protein